MNWNEADTAPETDISQELFESSYSTRELAYHLSVSIASQPHGGPAGNQMWKDYLANRDGSQDAPFWYRGNICRGLASLGTDLWRINRRKS